MQEFIKHSTAKHYIGQALNGGLETASRAEYWRQNMIYEGCVGLRKETLQIWSTTKRGEADERTKK